MKYKNALILLMQNDFSESFARFIIIQIQFLVRYHYLNNTAVDIQPESLISILIHFDYVCQLQLLLAVTY